MSSGRGGHGRLHIRRDSDEVVTLLKQAQYFNDLTSVQGKNGSGTVSTSARVGETVVTGSSKGTRRTSSLQFESADADGFVSYPPSPVLVGDSSITWTESPSSPGKN